MNKLEIIKLFQIQIASELNILTQSAEAALEAATHAESKAEDQYDTRGLEASYLAGAQSKRVMDLQETLALFQHIDLISFTKDSKITATALVTLESEGKISFYLLMPKGGGMQTIYNGQSIHVITPQSPLGAALLAKKQGDEIEILVQKVLKEYQVTTVE